MIRERTLKIVLAAVGLLFCAGIYPLLWSHPDPAEMMLGGVYVTLGVFLLLAFRNPAAHRSLIAFTAWSSLVHGGIMAVQAFRNEIPRRDLLVAVLPLLLIGAALMVLAPATEARLSPDRSGVDGVPALGSTPPHGVRR